MTLNDNKIFSDNNILITTWLQTLAQELIGKEKVLKPFWTKQCTEISQKLWLPTETDSVDLHSNFWNGSSQDLELNSWFSVKAKTNLLITNSQTTFSPLFMSIPVEEWEQEDILRTRKVRFYPTTEQRKTLRQWMGARRYVYNKVLHKIKNEKEEVNSISLRNKYVTYKSRDGIINPNVNSWENEVPSDIREEAVRDLVKNYNTAFANLRNNNINKFQMNYCNKKDNPSISIPLSAVKGRINIIQKTNEELKKVKVKEGQKKAKTRNQIEITKEDGGFRVYPTSLKGKLKIKNRQLRKKIVIDGNIRIKYENNAWYLIAPYKTKSNQKEYRDNGRYDYCALDPGVRTFQSIYSEQEIIQVKINKEIVKKYLLKLDKLRSLRDKKIIKGRKGDKIINRHLNNLIDDLHHKTANMLTKRYNVIILPPFESQEMVKKSRNSNLNRNLLQLKHYQFQQRLKSKCQLRYCDCVQVTEEYTSKTCGRCGCLNDVGCLDVYSCNRCGLEVDRDVNGSRNIFIKALF